MLTLWFGIGVDASAISYCSWVWKHYDLPPYVGCIEADYPGIFLIHRLALLFGENALGFRIFDLLVQLGVLVMIFYLARRVSGLSAAGLWSCLLYSTYYYGLGFQMTGQREGFVLWFMLAALITMLIIPRRFFLRAFLAAILLSFAFLTKPTFGLLWPVFGVWILAEGLRQRPRQVWIELAAFVLGCFLPPLIVIVAYWRWGYLSNLYELLYVFVLKIYPKIFVITSPIKAIPYLVNVILHEVFVAVLGALIGLALLWFYGDKKERKLYWLIIALIVASFISADLQHGYWEYHRIPFWGMVIIMAGGGWAWVLEFIKGRRVIIWRRFFQIALASLLLFLIFLRIPPDVRSFAYHYSFRSLKAAYMVQYPLPVMVADYIKLVINPDDQIFYFGNISMLPFLLNRKLAAPFPFTSFLYAPMADGAFSPLQQRWKKEYIDSFIKTKPRFFIFDTYCPICRNQSLVSIFRNEFPQIQEMLDQNYHLARTIYTIEVYELN